MRPPKRVVRRKKVRASNGLTLQASAEKASEQARRRRRQHLIPDLYRLYRPLKKPVTLRLDADVLAWFKKDGRRYQTRINGALRKVMEREMNEAEE